MDLGLLWTSAVPVFLPQLEEVKASERNLRARLKTLNCELAMYRRG